MVAGHALHAPVYILADFVSLGSGAIGLLGGTAMSAVVIAFLRLVKSMMTWPVGGNIGIALLSGLLAAGCQTSAKTDSGGQGMSLTEWSEINLQDSDIDLPLLLPVTISSIEKSVRDNAHPVNRYKLAGKGFATTQRVSFGWFSKETREEMLDRDAFAALAKSHLENIGGGDVVANKLEVSSWHVGYWSIVQTDRGPCFVGRSGVRVGTTAYDNDNSTHIDTVVTIVYCDRDVTHEMFASALGSPSLVLDREAYREALIKAGRLTTALVPAEPAMSRQAPPATL